MRNVVNASDIWLDQPPLVPEILNRQVGVLFLFALDKHQDDGRGRVCFKPIWVKAARRVGVSGPLHSGESIHRSFSRSGNENKRFLNRDSCSSSIETTYL